MRARFTVAVLTAALAVYFALLWERAIDLSRSGTVVGIGLGVGVFLLPVIGVVVVVMELRFGAATSRLARRLAAEDALPDDADLPRRPSGRVDRQAADAYFETVRERVQADPGDWRGWYALGHAYDLAGDRKRARSAVRHAIELADTDRA